MSTISSNTISGSVGVGGANQQADVETVQRLLNSFATAAGFGPLRTDGRIGPKSIAAIKAFQEKIVRLSQPDGRVDPNGVTFRKLGGTVATAGPAGVSGKTAGVNQDIIKYLEAVSSHYGKPIKVTSGKRDANGQANAMWSGWAGHLKHGKIYVYLQNHPVLREELDNYYKAGDKIKFHDKIVAIAGNLSRHLTGEAVDVDLLTDPKVLGALKAGLHYVAEESEGRIACHHFDTKKFGRAPEVTPELAASWPK